MRRHMQLLAVAGADDIEGVRSLLAMFFFAPMDPMQRSFQLQVGDEVTVQAVVLDTLPTPRDAEIVQWNAVAWPAPGRNRELFVSCFREDPDTPDAAILAAGRTRFAAGGPYVPLEGTRYPPSPEPLPSLERAQVFDLTFPRFILLAKPGSWVFTLSLTVRLGGETGVLQTFVTDPEMNVEGSYPPEPGGPPPGSNGSTER